MRLVRCSMRGMADQITGAVANQNAFAKRYSPSAVASNGPVGPGNAFGPISIPAKPERNGITESTPRVTCNARRPPSRRVNGWIGWVKGWVLILSVKHYYIG